MSADASSSASPGARSACTSMANWRLSRRNCVGPKPRTIWAMLSTRTCPLVDDGTVSLPIAATSSPLAFEDANLHRILLGAVAEGRDLVVARHHQPQRAADVRDPDAEIRGAGAVHRHVHFGAGVAEIGLGVDQARQLLRVQQELLRVVVQLQHVRALQRGLDREVAVAAAERVLRVDGRRQPRMPGQDLADAGHDLFLRDVALVARLQVEQDVEVVHAVGAGEIGDARHAFLTADLLDHLLGDLPRALERGPLRRVDVRGELAHVLRRNERAADHPVQRNRQRRGRRP